MRPTDAFLGRLPFSLSFSNEKSNCTVVALTCKRHSGRASLLPTSFPLSGEAKSRPSQPRGTNKLTRPAQRDWQQPAGEVRNSPLLQLSITKLLMAAEMLKIYRKQRIATVGESLSQGLAVTTVAFSSVAGLGRRLNDCCKRWARKRRRRERKGGGKGLSEELG